MMTFKVEKNVKIPRGTRQAHPFPFDDMDIGDSFAVKHSEMKAQTVGSRVSGRNKHNPEQLFVTRQIKGQGRNNLLTRVWRIK